MDTQQAIVIGGGPAGLASAAELQRAGIGVTVLEQAPGMAWSWRNRYDGLRLNSSRPFSKLPGSRYAKGTPMFPSRDEARALSRGLRLQRARRSRCARAWSAWTATAPAGWLHTTAAATCGPIR